MPLHPAARVLAIVAMAGLVLVAASLAGQLLADLRRGVAIGDALSGGASSSPFVVGPAAVPWSARVAPAWTPRPTPVATPPTARPCGAADVVAVDLGTLSVGPNYSAVLIANTSATPCRLSGIPAVTVLDGALRPLSFQVHGFDASPLGDVLLEPGHAAPTLDASRPGEARLQIAWVPRCGDRVTIGAIEIALAGGGTIRVTHPAVVTGVCINGVAPQPPEIAAAYAPTIYPTYPTPTPAPLILSAHISAPPSIDSNADVLRYTVTLTNETGSTYVFGDCPIYNEYFVKNVRRYYLNCESVPSLAPAASVTFEMQLDIDPRSLPPQADWDLHWELEPQPNSATATARIHVAFAALNPNVTAKPTTPPPPKGTP